MDTDTPLVAANDVFRHAKCRAYCPQERQTTRTVIRREVCHIKEVSPITLYGS